MFNQAHRNLSLLALGLALISAPASAVQEHGDGHDHGQGQGHAQADAAPAQEFSGDPYLLDFDPVTGDKLGPVSTQERIEYEGRELRFASKKSVEAFRSDPGSVLSHVDEALIAQQMPFYPLEVCPVTGAKLGEMGDPVDIVYKNRLVRLCCKGCKKKFRANPDKHIATLNKAVIAAQGPKYALATCVVTGESLEESKDEVVDYVIGNRLVRLCCKACVKKVAANPLAFLAKLDEASHAEGDHSDGHGDGGHGDGGHGDGGHGDGGHGSHGYGLHSVRTR